MLFGQNSKVLRKIGNMAPTNDRNFLDNWDTSKTLQDLINFLQGIHFNVVWLDHSLCL